MAIKNIVMKTNGGLVTSDHDAADSDVGMYVDGKKVAGEQQAAIADLTAAPTQADFNGLLAKLRAYGVIASE